MTRARGALFGSVLGAALVGGCQLIVPSDVPEFKCAGTDPSACPTGMACDLAAGKCVAAAASIVPEGGDPDVIEEGKDAAPDQDAGGLADLGATCVVNADCKSKLCGTATILTTAIVPANQKPLCTQTCCTSTDCPSGFVCFNGATGGAYCVVAAKAQRSVPGAKSPGQTCTLGTECRSGFCDKPDGGRARCLDTCCKPNDCTAGTVCRIQQVAIPAPGHFVWACAMPESGATLDAGPSPNPNCSSNSQCKTDACIGSTVSRYCRPPCCSKTSCEQQGFSPSHCVYGTTGTDFFKFCQFAAASGSPNATTCDNDSQCASDFCDPELKKCAEICCIDSDCAANQACRPSAVNTPFLRCVAR